MKKLIVFAVLLGVAGFGSLGQAEEEVCPTGQYWNEKTGVCVSGTDDVNAQASGLIRERNLPEVSGSANSEFAADAGSTAGTDDYRNDENPDANADTNAGAKGSSR